MPITKVIERPRVLRLPKWVTVEREEGGITQVLEVYGEGDARRVWEHTSTGVVPVTDLATKAEVLAAVDAEVSS